MLLAPTNNFHAPLSPKPNQDLEVCHTDYFNRKLLSMFSFFITGNTKVQLLSVVAGKDDSGKYRYTIPELLNIFPNSTEHYIRRARKHAEHGLSGIPIEPGRYSNWVRFFDPPTTTVYTSILKKRNTAYLKGI